MIFVTLGTHEQPFNRLIKKIDELKAQDKIAERVFIQTGYSTYVPTHCQHQAFVSPKKMQELIKAATTVITHGGPSTFIEVLRQGKTPLVVPRQKKFGEHVNDHQLRFCTELQKQGFPIDLVIDENDLLKVLNDRRQQPQEFTSNNQEFNQKLAVLIGQLF